MNILCIVPYVPSLVRVRPYHLIKGLTARGHRVTVLTLWSDGAERAELERLKTEAQEVRAAPITRLRAYWNSVRALPTTEPLQAAYCWQPALAEQMHRLVSAGNGKFDVVHVEHLRGARYGLDLKSHLAETGVRIPIVWDSVDCISLLFRQAAANGAGAFSRTVTHFELPRTERYEGWLLNQFDRVLVTSGHDAAALRSLNPNAQSVSVLSNGVDLEYFSANGSATRSTSAIVMSGKMSYHANVAMALYFVREVLPRVWAERRDAQLWIVGKDPPREVRELARHPRIKVTGTVADVRPYLRAAAVAVAPQPYAVGVQNKVLEAMACGTPVVASPQAASALQANSGRDLLVADDSKAFSRAVLSLLSDAGIRRSLGRAGRQYVEQHHRWSESVEKLEGIYDELIGAER